MFEHETRNKLILATIFVSRLLDVVLHRII
jgi:hypothetical protein